MKHTGCWIFMAIVVATPSALAPQATVANPAEQVATLHAAMAAGDSAAAVALLASGVIIYEAGGVESSRDEFASHHLAIDMDFSSSTTREVLSQASRVSGNVAWVLSTTSVTGIFRDNPINSRGTETMILAKSEAGWRITHIHWSSRQQRRGG